MFSARLAEKLPLSFCENLRLGSLVLFSPVIVRDDDKILFVISPDKQKVKLCDLCVLCALSELGALCAFAARPVEYYSTEIELFARSAIPPGE